MSKQQSQSHKSKWQEELFESNKNFYTTVLGKPANKIESNKQQSIYTISSVNTGTTGLESINGKLWTKKAFQNTHLSSLQLQSEVSSYQGATNLLDNDDIVMISEDEMVNKQSELTSEPIVEIQRSQPEPLSTKVDDNQRSAQEATGAAASKTQSSVSKNNKKTENKKPQKASVLTKRAKANETATEQEAESQVTKIAKKDISKKSDIIPQSKFMSKTQIGAKQQVAPKASIAKTISSETTKIGTAQLSSQTMGFEKIADTVADGNCGVQAVKQLLLKYRGQFTTEEGLLINDRDQTADLEAIRGDIANFATIHLHLQKDLNAKPDPSKIDKVQKALEKFDGKLESCKQVFNCNIDFFKSVGKALIAERLKHQTLLPNETNMLEQLDLLLENINDWNDVFTLNNKQQNNIVNMLKSFDREALQNLLESYKFDSIFEAYKAIFNGNIDFFKAALQSSIDERSKNEDLQLAIKTMLEELNSLLPNIRNWEDVFSLGKEKQSDIVNMLQNLNFNADNVLEDQKISYSKDNEDTAILTEEVIAEYLTKVSSNEKKSWLTSYELIAYLHKHGFIQKQLIHSGKGTVLGLKHYATEQEIYLYNNTGNPSTSYGTHWCAVQRAEVTAHRDSIPQAQQQIPVEDKIMVDVSKGSNLIRIQIPAAKAESKPKKREAKAQEKQQKKQAQAISQDLIQKEFAILFETTQKEIANSVSPSIAQTLKESFFSTIVHKHYKPMLSLLKAVNEKDKQTDEKLIISIAKFLNQSANIVSWSNISSLLNGVGANAAEELQKLLTCFGKKENQELMKTLNNLGIKFSSLSSIITGAGANTAEELQKLLTLLQEKQQLITELKELGIKFNSLSSMLHGARDKCVEVLKELLTLLQEKQDLIKTLKGLGIEFSSLSSILNGAGVKGVEMLEKLFDCLQKNQKLIKRLKDDLGIEFSSLSSMLNGAGAKCVEVLEKLFDCLQKNQGLLKTLKDELGIEFSSFSSMLHGAGDKGVEVLEKLFDCLQKNQGLLKTLKDDLGIEFSSLSSMLHGAGAKCVEVLEKLFDWLQKNQKLIADLKVLEIKFSSFSSILAGAGDKGVEELEKLFDCLNKNQGLIKRLKDLDIEFNSLSSILNGAGDKGVEVLEKLLTYLEENQELIADLKVLEIKFSSFSSIIAGARDKGVEVLEKLFARLKTNQKLIADLKVLEIKFSSFSSILNGAGDKGVEELEKLFAFFDQKKNQELVKTLNGLGVKFCSLSCLINKAGDKGVEKLKELLTYLQENQELIKTLKDLGIEFSTLFSIPDRSSKDVVLDFQKVTKVLSQNDLSNVSKYSINLNWLLMTAKYTFIPEKGNVKVKQEVDINKICQTLQECLYLLNHPLLLEAVPQEAYHLSYIALLFHGSQTPEKLFKGLQSVACNDKADISNLTLDAVFKQGKKLQKQYISNLQAHPRSIGSGIEEGDVAAKQMEDREVAVGRVDVTGQAVEIDQLVSLLTALPSGNQYNEAKGDMLSYDFFSYRPLMSKFEESSIDGVMVPKYELLCDPAMKPRGGQLFSNEGSLDNFPGIPLNNKIHIILENNVEDAHLIGDSEYLEFSNPH